MALALPKSSAALAADIICDLENARGRPDAALRSAVQCADQIAPAVIAVVDLAAEGAYLLPKQRNLLFWGIHVLAAARRAELYQPLMRFLSRASESQLDLLLGDAATETLNGILLSVFDGNATPIIETCLNPRADGMARWTMLQVLARLTFDGAVPRDTTHDVLVRFERESLAKPRNAAWMGWQDAVVLLGVEELRDRMHATWNDGRNWQRKVDRDDYDLTLSKTRAMAPGDPALFIEQRIVALDDPVAALGWLAPQSDTEQNVRDRLALPLTSDPGDLFALRTDEIDWLTGFFDHKYSRSSGILEILDGYFCGLIAAPGTAHCADYLSEFWNSGPLSEIPGGRLFDSSEHQEHVNTLLTRHWNTIAYRLDGGHSHAPLLHQKAEVPEAACWAVGFLLAMTLRVRDWKGFKGDDFLAGLLAMLKKLAGRIEVSQRKLTDRERSEIVELLPIALQVTYDRSHGRIDPLVRHSVPPGALGMKIGRNDPCPCGSGKKYKRCCGSSDKSGRN